MKGRLLVIIGLLLACPLLAQDQPRFEISPHYGYRWGGGFETSDGRDINLKADRAYGLSFDYTPCENSDLKLEALWSRQDSGVDFENEAGLHHVGVTVDEFLVGGVLETAYGRLHPYITGLVGASLFGPEGSDSAVRFCFSIGGGAKFFLIRNLALRADVRGYCNVVDSESAVISSGGATVAHFHGTTMWQGEVSGGITLAF